MIFKISSEKIEEFIEKQHSIDGMVSMHDFELWLEEQPRVGEWIPCSERLPEERDWYLAVFREKDTGFQLVPRIADWLGCETEYTTAEGWQFVDDIGKYTEYKKKLVCVAWMPLPSAYKENKE